MSENNIVICSAVELKRNIKNYPFTERMSSAQKTELLSTLMLYFNSRAYLLPFKFEYSEAAFLNEYETDLLFEEGIITKRKPEASGIGFFRDTDTAVVIGDKEHISIKTVHDGFSLNEAYKKALLIDDVFCDDMPLAFSEKFGYLFSNVLSNGSGLEAFCTVHLPALEHLAELKKYIESMNNFGISIEKIGEFGSNYIIRNCLFSGINETDYLNNLSAVVKTVSEEEKSARAILIKNNEIYESIIMALNTLKSSMSMCSNIYLQLISLVKIGISEKVIFGIKNSEIDKFTFLLKDSTLRSNLKNKDTDERRAELVRSLFSKAFY